MLVGGAGWWVGLVGRWGLVAGFVLQRLFWCEMAKKFSKLCEALCRQNVTTDSYWYLADQ